MYIGLQLPSKKTFKYKVSIKIYNADSLKTDNILNYNTELSVVRESLSGYIVSIKRSNLLLNHTKDNNALYEIISITSEIFNDLKLNITHLGTIKSVDNFKEILKKWELIVFKIESTYKGDIVKKVLDPMRNHMASEDNFIKVISMDTFFYYYFNIFHNYSGNQLQLKGHVHQFLDQKLVETTLDFNIQEDKNDKSKTIEIQQTVSEQKKDELQSLYAKKKGVGILDLDMKMKYSISKSKVIDKIEVLHKAFWSNQLIKYQEITILRHND